MGERNLPALPFESVFRLPDKGVMNYVRDMLEHLGVETESLPEHWLPVGIIGTLDWVMICGWWVYRNTSFFDSDEPYHYVFEFDGYEFDPDMLLVFREDRERNKFGERIDNPGIDGMERTEALQFLQDDVYGSWARGKGVNAEEFTPPQEFIEMLMWATFMWILSEYGRDWIYSQDEVLACVIEYGAAYIEKWTDEQALLDPTKVKRIERPINSCRYCGETLWCVRGAKLQKKWQFICINCFVKAWEDGVDVDTRDDRVQHPKCPHLEGIQGSTQSCTATCPHSQMNEEKVWKKMEQVGSERLEKYREHVRSMGGSNPRQLAGQTLDDLIDYFR